MIQYRIISIGALSHHPLWAKRMPMRTAHATTVLIETGDKKILIDPGLPSPAIEARLAERAGLTPAEITDVFLTNFRPAHRAGLGAFGHANCYLSEREREAVGMHLLGQFEQTEDEDAKEILRHEIALLKQLKSAPDSLAPQVDLFPLGGYTPGTTGVLICLPNATILVASDAVPTYEHMAQGQILQGGYDLDEANESFKEAVEIADFIIPGHDNIMPNMTRRMM